MPADARIADITESDLPDVAEFLARQTPPGDGRPLGSDSTLRRLRWLLLDNPARRADVPFGWCLRAAGDQRVVGAMLCVPYRLGHRGAVYTALMSCKFFVDEPYRGMGLGLFMRYLKLGTCLGCPLFCTTANRASGELWERFGGYPIPGTDHEMIGVARFAPLAEEWAHRRWRRPWFARGLAVPAGFWIAKQPWYVGPRDVGRLSSSPLASADEAAAALPSACDGEAAVVRDRDYVHWRYFAGPDGRQVFRFDTPGEPPRLVVAGLTRRGYRGQIRALTVMDVWPSTTPDSAFDLVAALAAQYRGRFDVLAVRAQAAETEAALSGFRRHEYPAPLGWCIDRAGVLPSRQWYVMPGEAE